MTKIVVDKVRVAQRQIDAAIRMLFGNEDAIPIHTVLGAGFRILRDLIKHKKVDPPAFEKLVRPERMKEFWNKFNAPYNFFKHADTDPEEVLDNVDEEVNDLLLFIAITYYEVLGESLTIEMKAYQAWFLFSYPSLFFPPLVELLKPLGINQFQNMSRTERLEHGLLVIEAIKLQEGLSNRNI